MTDRANLLCLVAFIIALTWRGDVLALPVLDQSHVPVSENAGPSITGDFTPAQTFTVGLTGQLTSIDVYMFASEPDIAADVTIEESCVRPLGTMR